MSRVRVPDQQEERILRENGMDPNAYGVMHSGDGNIRLLCYKTRDIIEIWKGDRPW